MDGVTLRNVDVKKVQDILIAQHANLELDRVPQ